MDTEKKNRPSVYTKRCPNCSAELLLDYAKCPGCGIKVGKVDRFGRAKERIDWAAYAVCVVSWILFGFFVWWGFFKN